jgi:aerobic-type carbon monoxide dehydrogenase small subunit (CoxS/CutS family)
MTAAEVAPADSIITMVDGVAMVTREPLDRLQQIIAQSWYWIGGYCAPTDINTSTSNIPTATNAAYKRAVMIEHVG